MNETEAWFVTLHRQTPNGPETRPAAHGIYATAKEACIDLAVHGIHADSREDFIYQPNGNLAALVLTAPEYQATVTGPIPANVAHALTHDGMLWDVPDTAEELAK